MSAPVPCWVTWHVVGDGWGVLEVHPASWGCSPAGKRCLGRACAPWAFSGLREQLLHLSLPSRRVTRLPWGIQREISGSCKERDGRQQRRPHPSVGNRLRLNPALCVEGTGEKKPQTLEPRRAGGKPGETFRGSV